MIFKKLYSAFQNAKRQWEVKQHNKLVCEWFNQIIDELEEEDTAFRHYIFFRKSDEGWVSFYEGSAEGFTLKATSHGIIPEWDDDSKERAPIINGELHLSNQEFGAISANDDIARIRMVVEKDNRSMASIKVSAGMAYIVKE